MEPYCPFTSADAELNRVINSYSIRMALFYYRTQYLHLTQKEMAIVTGLSMSTIQRIEAGKEANFSNIIRYAQACGCEIGINPIKS